MQDWTRSIIWGELTRAEIAAARDAGAIPVLPLGAIEQHADHLPVDTDASSAFGVTKAAVGLCCDAKILILPVQSFGFSHHHRSWPGTVSLSTRTLISIVEDIGESLDRTGFKKMLVVNGHGGNEGSLLSACNGLICRGIGMGYVNYFNPGRGQWLAKLPGLHRDLGHACAYESSMQLALKPEQGDVIRTRLKDLPPRLDPSFSGEGNLETIRAAGLNWSWLYRPGDVGYYGDPAAAVNCDPAEIMQLTAEALARFFDDFAKADLLVGA